MKEYSDYFGKFVMTHMRDAAIRNFDHLAAGKHSVKWHKNISRQIAQIENSTKELFRILFILVMEEMLHEFFLNLQETEITDTPISIRVGDQDITKQPGDIGSEYLGWLEKYSQYPEAMQLLKKYGTDGWPRILLRESRGAELRRFPVDRNSSPETGEFKNLRDDQALHEDSGSL